MGKFQAMNKHLAVFLALVACHDSLMTTHGRDIKPLTQDSSLSKGTVVAEDSPQPLKASVNTVPAPSSEKKDDSTVTVTPNRDSIYSCMPNHASGMAYMGLALIVWLVSVGFLCESD
ncbi:hypothetical protein E2542_SST20143 [Spatholobus suberectus]|nr:hypothetical protein E2542_SST20143 [Spatholobus suberectus]